MEPEHIAVTENSNTAYVTLQVRQEEIMCRVCGGGHSFAAVAVLSRQHRYRAGIARWSMEHACTCASILRTDDSPNGENTTANGKPVCPPSHTFR